MNNYVLMSRQQLGVTLLDLLTTLSISAILSTTAFSGLIAMKDSFDVIADKNRLLTLIKSARQTAITNNSYATICHVENNECSEFSSPLTVFTDNNNNQTLDSDEVTIALTKISSNAAIYWNRHKSIRFEPNGRAGGYNGTLRYCAQDKGFDVIISRTGRIRTKSNKLCG